MSDVGSEDFIFTTLSLSLRAHHHEPTHPTTQSLHFHHHTSSAPSTHRFHPHGLHPDQCPSMRTRRNAGPPDEGDPVKPPNGDRSGSAGDAIATHPFHPNKCGVVPCHQTTDGAHKCLGCGCRVHSLCQQLEYRVEGGDVGFWCGGTRCAAQPRAGPPSPDLDEPASAMGYPVMEETSDCEEQGDESRDGADAEPRSSSCAAGANCEGASAQMTGKTPCCGHVCHMMCASECSLCNNSSGERWIQNLNLLSSNLSCLSRLEGR